MTYIKEQYHSNLTLVEAEKLAFQTLKNVMEDKITIENVEISVVKCDTKLLESRNGEYRQNIINGLS